MRILQVAPPWFEVPPQSYGGTELVIAALADGLVAAGHDVTLLASGGSRTGAELRSVYAQPPSADLGDPMTELLHVMAVDDLGPFDIVHDHTLIGTARLAARGTRPLVHTLHAAWSDRAVGVYRRLADHVALAAISHAQAEAAPTVPIAAVVHHGIEVAHYPIGLDRTDELVFVGRANPEKGPEQAIEVARRTGRGLQMAIKVNERDEHEYWRSVLAPRLHDVEAHVVFDATHEQKVTMMARAHAVIMPIQWDEPFGLVMLEAAACGTPMVVYGRGAAPELVRDGVTGYVVPPAAGLDALCHAVEAAERIDPATCRQHVHDHFSSERMVERHLDLYERLAMPRFKRTRPAALAPPFAGSPAIGEPASSLGSPPSRANGTYEEAPTP